MKMKLPTRNECFEYLDSIGYEFDYRAFAGEYVFKDRTGKRPLHNRVMYWTLREMRDAVRFGC